MTATEPTPGATIVGHQQDRRLVGILIATLVVTVVSVAIGAILIKVGVDSQGGIDAQTRSDEIAACRSERRGGIDRAIDQLEAARVRRDDALIGGLVAVVTNDDAALDQLVAVADDVRAETAAALEAKEQATRDYQDAVELSRTNPTRFLADCRAGRDRIVFTDCEAAEASGLTPIRRGDPGYTRDLDTDGDGIACE